MLDSLPKYVFLNDYAAVFIYHKIKRSNEFLSTSKAEDYWLSDFVVDSSKDLGIRTRERENRGHPWPKESGLCYDASNKVVDLTGNPQWRQMHLSERPQTKVLRKRPREAGDENDTATATPTKQPRIAALTPVITPLELWASRQRHSSSQYLQQYQASAQYFIKTDCTPNPMLTSSSKTLLVVISKGNRNASALNDIKSECRRVEKSLYRFSPQRGPFITVPYGEHVHIQPVVTGSEDGDALLVEMDIAKYQTSNLAESIEQAAYFTGEFARSRQWDELLLVVSSSVTQDSRAVEIVDKVLGESSR